MLRHTALVWLGVWASAGAACAADDLTAARDELRAGRFAAARDLLTKAIEADPKSASGYALRAGCEAALDNHAAAVSDCGKLLELDADRPDVYEFRGSQKFMLLDFDGSIADFDREIELRPERKNGHWKRGISYYYAGRFGDGARQFEGFVEVEAQDVENSVWRYLCMARDVGAERARREMLRVEHDRRVPMMQVFDLFRGEGSEQQVREAVERNEPTAGELVMRRFYMHLYLGLWDDISGRREAALEHLRAAVEEHKLDHYMWQVARVHRAVLAKPQPQTPDR